MRSGAIQAFAFEHERREFFLQLRLNSGRRIARPNIPWWRIFLESA